MDRPKDPRTYRRPLLPTPMSIDPAYNPDTYYRYLESIDLISEFNPSSLNVASDIPSESIGNDSNFIPEPIDPKLDFCSDSFDPNFFLGQPCEIIKKVLPYPKAKEYNNLADYYSHHFLKKDTAKKAEKDRLYDRDYAWYYKILGWNNKIQKRYEQRKLRRRRKYAGWLTAKLRKYEPHFSNNDPNYEPCRSFPPLQSTKIIQTQSKFRKYKIFPRNAVTDSKESSIEVNDVPELNLDKESLIQVTKEVDSSNVTETENNSATTKTDSSSRTTLT